MRNPQSLARDKRALARIPCASPCEIFFGGARRQGMLGNASAFGVYVALCEPLPSVDSRVVLTFLLPGETAPMACVGSVRWVNEPSTFKGYGSTKPSLPPGCGIEFLVLDMHDRQRIVAQVREGLGPAGSRALRAAR